MCPLQLAYHSEGKIGGGKAFKENGSHLIHDLRRKVGGRNDHFRSLMWSKHIPVNLVHQTKQTVPLMTWLCAGKYSSSSPKHNRSTAFVLLCVFVFSKEKKIVCFKHAEVTQ